MAGNNIYVKGSYIDVHDNQNVYLSVDKAQVRVAGKDAEVTEEVSRGESPDTSRTSSPAAPAPLTANQKVTACFEHGLLTAGKPYNQLFCLMAAMMARRILTDTSVPAFVRMVAHLVLHCYKMAQRRKTISGLSTT